jgi:DNA mismatch repair protein MutL
VQFRYVRQHAIVRRLSTRTSFPAAGVSLALPASVGNTGARQPRICPVETDATHSETAFPVPPPYGVGDGVSPPAADRVSAAGAIRVLPVGVAAGIAAGETIERPASVVKELVENAIDAGATAVRIDIRGGGLDLIRVGDDGRGMRAADLWLACQRHATSKYPAEGLGAVRTLGFRGEALPSIAGVAELDLVSATGTGAGWRLTLRGGRVLRDEPAPRPAGTTVTVRGLFADLPARRSTFTGTGARGETTQIAATVRRLALAAPGVRFSLHVEDRLALQTSGSDDLLSALTEIYGHALFASLVALGPVKSAGAIEGGFRDDDVVFSKADPCREDVAMDVLAHPRIAGSIARSVVRNGLWLGPRRAAIPGSAMIDEHRFPIRGLFLKHGMPGSVWPDDAGGARCVLKLGQPHSHAEGIVARHRAAATARGPVLACAASHGLRRGLFGKSDPDGGSHHHDDHGNHQRRTAPDQRIHAALAGSLGRKRWHGCWRMGRGGRGEGRYVRHGGVLVHAMGNPFTFKRKPYLNQCSRRTLLQKPCATTHTGE